jgi:hypothetical protein
LAAHRGGCFDMPKKFLNEEDRRAYNRQKSQRHYWKYRQNEAHWHERLSKGRIWRRKNPRVKNRTQYFKDYRQRPESAAQAKQYYLNKSAEAKKAHWTVGNAIRSGKLRPLPCSVCGASKTHAHHEDYSKPLKVIWLCPKHHMQKHLKPTRLTRAQLRRLK